jgi:hypothetical protein
MKRVKRLVLVTALVSVSIAGVYSLIVPTSAQDYASPQCECKYPGPPEQYGVKKPAMGTNDNHIYTCEVKKCWLPVSAFDPESGGQN